MRRFLLAGVAALALTGCTAFEDAPATIPGGALARVAERLAAGGDAATAAALYRSAIAMGNTAPEVRRGYGNALLALGQPLAAIEQLEAALPQTKDARLYNSLGVAYDMIGDHARAQERFREGLALAPDNKGLIHNYGLSLAAAPEPEKEEKTQEPIAEVAPEAPREFAPATAAFEPVPQDEPNPIARPAAVPSVIPTMKSRPVAMRDSLPEPVARDVTPPTPKPVAMRDSLSEPVAVQVAVTAPQPVEMSEPVAVQVAVTAPQPVEMPEPGALQVAATAPQPVEMPEPGALQVAATTPEPAALMQLAVASAPDPAPAADPAPATSESPFIRINEIVPLGRPVATPLHGGYFRARLAGYASRERTVEFRREIERQVPELRDSMRVVKERPSLALGARLRYTLVTAPLPSRRAAEDACDTLAERGVACLAEPAASPLTLRS